MKTENKQRMLIVLILCLIVVSTAYVALTGLSVAEETVKIGAVFHLSGPGAFWGEGERNGALLAIEEINAVGGIDGKDLEMIIEDTRTDFSQTINSIQKLANVDKLDIIIGPTWFGQVVSPLAEQLEVLVVSPSTGTVPSPNSYFFNLWPTENQETSAMAGYIVEKNDDNVVIVYSLNEWSQSMRDNFREQTEKNNIEVIGEFSTSPDEKDFRTVILKIDELDPDAIYAPFAFYPSQGAFSKQVKEFGLNITLYSSSGTENPVLLQSFPEIEGTIYPYPITSNKEIEFREKYFEKYNSLASPSSAYAYDSVNLIAKALKEGKSTPEEISEYLMELKDYPGVSNTISFDKDGRIVQKKHIIKVVKNGEFISYFEIQ